MDLLKKLGIVLLWGVVISVFFYIAVAFIVSKLIEKPWYDENDYEAIYYGVVAMIPGAIIGLIYGIYWSFFKKKSV